jgi:glycerol uptake facilitator-like aquaporin
MEESDQDVLPSMQQSAATEADNARVRSYSIFSYGSIDSHHGDQLATEAATAVKTVCAPMLVEFVGTFFLCLVVSVGGESDHAMMKPLAIGGILVGMVFMGGPGIGL